MSFYFYIMTVFDANILLTLKEHLGKTFYKHKIQNAVHDPF